MTIELLPQGFKCSLACDYCYQVPVRNAGNSSTDYDMDAMKAALTKENYRFTIFGGEPLLVPIDDLEELWRFGQEKFQQNGVQTHGADMTPAHIDLFRKYNVYVGMSIDGPGEMNDARWSGSLERTRETTAKSISNLHELLSLKHPVSLIVTLTKKNASAERLPRLLDWFKDLSDRGLAYVNLHLLEVDNPGVREELALSVDENVAALMSCRDLEQGRKIRFVPVGEMIKLLQGDDSQVSCTWNGCDPYTTAAVQGINGKGEKGNCGRTSKDGPLWEKAQVEGYERYLALAHTPFEYGGCKGCRFFMLCKGHCPGEGDGNDWRGKTEHCATLMQVFTALEAEVPNPITLSPKRAAIEAKQIEIWKSGRNATLRSVIHQVDNPEATLTRFLAQQTHGDAPHGDTPHGDSHGDHTDYGRAK